MTVSDKADYYHDLREWETFLLALIRYPGWSILHLNDFVT